MVYIQLQKKNKARVTHETSCLNHILRTEKIIHSQRRGRTVYQDIWSLKLRILGIRTHLCETWDKWDIYYRPSILSISFLSLFPLYLYLVDVQIFLASYQKEKKCNSKYPTSRTMQDWYFFLGVLLPNYSFLGSIMKIHPMIGSHDGMGICNGNSVTSNLW